jgi:chitodextrinase
MRQTVSEFAGTGVGDTQAPSVPANLTATAPSSNQINLSWAASTDNVGVSGYEVYRFGIIIGSSPTTSYIDTGLSASTVYSYTVKARDAAGNVSAASNAVSLTTPSSGPTGAALARTGWTATSSPSGGEVPANLFDGNMATRWTTGVAMASGQSLTVDMQAVKTFNKLVMDSTGSDQDYARGYQVFVSNDGTNWGSAIATGTGTGPVVTVTFTARSARYIQVVQTGTATSWWSARELNVYY